MLNRRPLSPDLDKAPEGATEAASTPDVPDASALPNTEVAPAFTAAPTSVAAPAPAPVAKDALAGAFASWDLLPPDAFVKRVTRKKAETPTL